LARNLEEVMARTLFIPALALVCLALPAQAQAPAPVNPQDFPDGPGKEIVTTTCNTCHPASRVRAGYTPQGWDSVMHMMRNFGAPVEETDWPKVEAYLTKNFPERARPAAKIIPGPVQVAITEWPLPTPGSRPHDPMAAKDGSIWYTGQLANVLGRLDPKTGKIKEYHLERPMTAPHGLTEDKDGNIWFTGNFAGLIGKLDPKTGKVTEYPIPDPAAKDPHTLTFDHNGILWFTVQQGNFVGRLDPKTGAIKVVHPPTANARPYGMAVNSKNDVFFVEFGSNKVATIDDDMKITEYPLPDPAARPRRIAIGPDDIVWYTDFARGYLGRLDPASGKVTEWLSPSGPKSEPYGIVFTKGALWYDESYAKPNAIVRFDPKTEKFQTWAIPGGGDIVRNMSVTTDGNPVMANSLVNKVGLIAVK
jgi:virginiamycin B lyase